MDGKFIRLKETLMTSLPELEVLHADRKSSSGWTETQALESALEEQPVTVLMYCLHAMNINVREAFPPTTLATVVHAKRRTTREVGGASTGVGGDNVGEGGVDDEVGGVGDEEEDEQEEEDKDDEEEAEEEENEDGEDNAITIQQIADWLKVNLHLQIC